MRYLGSQAAHFLRRLMDRLSVIWRTRLSAKWRTTAMFLAQCPMRRRDRSSLKITSRAQCRLFSMRQWSRTALCKGCGRESARGDVGSPFGLDFIAAFNATFDHGDGGDLGEAGCARINVLHIQLASPMPTVAHCRATGPGRGQKHSATEPNGMAALG